MTDTSSPRRRRRSSTSFAPASTSGSGGGGGGDSLGWKTMAALGAAPALLCVAHLTFGANHPVAALWFTVLLALSLGVALAFPTVRRGLHDISPLTPFAILFGLTLAVALWTLTDLAPGGAHPIWAWASADRGSITVNRPATLFEITKLLGLGCIFLVGCLQSARLAWARATVRAAILVGAAYGALSLLLFVSRTQNGDINRLAGGFLSPNTAATVFGMLTVIGLACLLRDWRQTRGLDPASKLGKIAVALGCVLLSITCLLLSASRMGAVATLCGAVVLLVWELFDSRHDRVPLLIAAGVMALLAAIVAVSSSGLLFERFGTTGADGIVRADIFTPHWRAFLDSPLFGYGLGSFSDVNTQITTAENYGALWRIRAVHNVYLQWLEEAGLLGALPMFLLIASILVAAVWRTFTLRKGQTLLRGLIVASVVVLVHGTTDFALQVPSVAAFWAFLLGCQFSFGRR